MSATQFEVQRMKSGKATRGKVVATFDTAREAVKFAEAQDKDRHWSDPWHQVKKVSR